MASTSTDQSKILEGELTCPVCLDILDDPHMLPCGHNFCLACVRRLKRQTERSRFRCPECRESHRSGTQPLKNFKLANIAGNFRKTARAARAPAAGEVEHHPGRTRTAVLCDYCPPFQAMEAEAEAASGSSEAAGSSRASGDGSMEVLGTERASWAVKTCLKCEVSMCQEHLKPHLELLAFREHPLSEPLTDLRNRKCLEHDEMYRYYCMEDKVCVCNACTIEGHHSGHTIKTLKNTMTDLKRVSRAQLVKLESKLSKAERILQELQEEERVNKNFQDSCEHQVISLGEVLYASVEEFLNSLRVCASTHSSAVNTTIVLNSSRVSQDQVRLRELRGSIEGLLQENDPFHFLEVHRSTSKRHSRQLKKNLHNPTLQRLDYDTLGNELEAKLEEFLHSIRVNTTDAIDVICPVEGEELDEEPLTHEDDDDVEAEEGEDDDDEDNDDEAGDEEEDLEEEMQSEGEEEEVGSEYEVRSHESGSADELYTPETEDEEEEEEEQEDEDVEEEEGVVEFLRRVPRN